MTKKFLSLALMALPLMASAQYAFDVLQYSQTELRGTSRFVSMGGAFGALGGDLSVITQNPGGIGVYRSADIGVSFALDFNSTQCTGENIKYNKGMFTNLGFVGVLKTNSDIAPTFSYGLSYNRINSFRRHYSGYMANIPTSVTNYFAEKAMADQMTAGDLLKTDNYNPYYDGNARWDQIAAYNADLIGTDDADGRKFSGLGYDGVVGEGEWEVEEWGHTDEYDVSFGGSISNKLFWGFTIGVTDMEYESYKYYGEVLHNTVIYDEVGGVIVPKDGDAKLGIVNESRTKGTGINGKIGLIFKPVNALRLGVAFHSPTYYSMKDVYSGNISAEYFGDNIVSPYTREEYYPENYVEYMIRTPWKAMGSVATVIGKKGILSADYEYTANNSMRILDERGKEYLDATQEIKTYLKPTHALRVGAEYRVAPTFSLRAGYAYQTTGTDSDVQDDKVDVEVAGTNPTYTYDTSTQYITAGVGFHKGSFYGDLAYVNQLRKSNYHAFSGIVDLPTVMTQVKDNNHRVQATIGFRF